MASPLRSAILRGLDHEEQETPKQEQAEKSAPPPPKPGLGALARAIGRGKEVKKVTIVGGGGGAGDDTAKKSGPKHGDKHPYSPEEGANTLVYDSVAKKWVQRRNLSAAPDRVVIEK